VSDNDWLSAKAVYMVMAAIAGAITSLAFMPWKSMTMIERALSLFVGSSFALLFVPWAVADIMHVNIDAIRAACAVTYIGAVAAPALIPPLIRKLVKWGGLDEGGKA
jgi:hypothetical protein